MLCCVLALPSLWVSQSPLQSPLRPRSAQSPLQRPLRPRSAQSPLQRPLRPRSAQSPLQRPLRPRSAQSPLQRPLRPRSAQSPLQRPLRPRSAQSPLQRPLRPRSAQSPLSSRSHPALLRLCWSRPALLRLCWSRPALLCLRWSRPAHRCLCWSCSAHPPRAASVQFCSTRAPPSACSSPAPQRISAFRAPPRVGPVQLIFVSTGPVQLIFFSAGPVHLTVVFAGPVQLASAPADSVQFGASRAFPRPRTWMSLDVRASRVPPWGSGAPQGLSGGELPAIAHWGPEPAMPMESPDSSWLPEALDLPAPPRRAPVSSAPPRWAPVSSAPPWWAHDLPVTARLCRPARVTSRLRRPARVTSRLRRPARVTSRLHRPARVTSRLCCLFRPARVTSRLCCLFRPALVGSCLIGSTWTWPSVPSPGSTSAPPPSWIMLCVKRLEAALRGGALSWIWLPLTTTAHHPWTTSPIMHCTHTFPSTITPITQLSPITNLPWLPHHTCTSFTHSHISSTHTLTHCEVLFCPGWHSERFPCILFPWTAYTTLTICCLPSWPCLPCDILSVCRLPRPVHCPCC